MFTCTARTEGMHLREPPRAITVDDVVCRHVLHLELRQLFDVFAFGIAPPWVHLYVHMYVCMICIAVRLKGLFGSAVHKHVCMYALEALVP